MSTLDLAPLFPSLHLTLASFGAFGPSGGMSVGGAVAGAWPVANTAYFCPIRVPLERTLTAFSVMCSSPVSGNFDLGLYTHNWKLLASTGSTAVGIANNFQKVTLATPLILPSDAYYMAIVVDNTVGFYIHSTAGAPGPDYHRVLGMAEQANAFPLPATATPGSITVLHIPWFGLVFAGAPV